MSVYQVWKPCVFWLRQFNMSKVVQIELAQPLLNSDVVIGQATKTNKIIVQGERPKGWPSLSNNSSTGSRSGPFMA